MPLAVCGQTGRYQHLAARLHAHVSPLVGADPGSFDVARHAETDVSPLRTGRGLVRAKVGEADHAERHLEAGGVVAAVVARGAAILEGDPDVPRKLVGLDQIATSHLHRIESELTTDQSDHALHDERAVRPSGATIRCDLDLVRVDDVELDLVVADAVRS